MQLAIISKHLSASLQKLELNSTAGLTMLLNAIFLVLLEKEVHYNFQKTCYKLQSPTATCNVFKISLQSLQKLGLSSTAGLAVLTNAIFLMMLEKEIHYSFQKTCHTLEFPNPTCNIPKYLCASLQKLELSSTAGLTMLLNAIFLVMFETGIHYNFQKTCHTLQSPIPTYNDFKISLQSMRKLELSSTAGLTRLLNAIFLIMLEKEIHYNFQNTCHTLESPTATCNHSKISLQSLQKLQLSSTVGLTLLHNVIFLIILEKQIHYNFQNTCHILESPTATCNHFKISLESLQNLQLSSAAGLTVLHNSYNVGKRNPFATSRIHVTRWNLPLQLAVISKYLCNR